MARAIPIRRVRAPYTIEATTRLRAKAIPTAAYLLRPRQIESRLDPRVDRILLVGLRARCIVDRVLQALLCYAVSLCQEAEHPMIGRAMEAKRRSGS